MSNKINETSESENKAEDIGVEMQIVKPPPPSSKLWGECLFIVAEAIAILFYALFAEYGEGIAPDSKMTEAEGRDLMQGFYPFFQDVHVMIFIGFGFLMAFIKTSCWSALCFNWVVSIWALQWGLLSNGFWH